MGLTPIEDREESRDRGPTADGPSGVRPRLRALATRLVDAVWDTIGGLLPGRGTSGGDATRGGGADGNCRAIRTSGERQLEGRRRRQTPQLPRGRNDAQTGEQWHATMVGDRLRIQDSDRPDAYISSDVYERVER